MTVDVGGFVPEGRGWRETISVGRSTILVSSLVRLRGPRRNWRDRKAPMSGTSIGEDAFVAGSCSKLFNRQQPPPQQTFPTSLVTAPLNGARIL